MAKRAKSGTLVASTVATVTLTQDAGFVWIVNRDGAAEIWVRTDGTDPTVAGDECVLVPKTVGATRVRVSGVRNDSTVVKLISSGTPAYSVLTDAEMALGASTTVSATIGEIEVKNDSGSPVPTTDAAVGAAADAAWSGSGSSTLVSALKAIYGKVAATLGFSVNAGVTDATTLRVITASDGPLNTNLGATTDAAVVTDANGSLSGKIRGLVKVFASVWNVTLTGLRIAPQQGAITDRSGTITTGGASQVLMSANADRRYLFIQNVSTGDLWVRLAATAAVADQPSILIPPRMAFVQEASFVCTSEIRIIGATTGQAYSAKEA